MRFAFPKDIRVPFLRNQFVRGRESIPFDG
jgi:hypothetical protein